MNNHSEKVNNHFVLNSNSEADMAFVELLKRNDEGAFAAIYNKYADELYRHARRVVPHKEDCEEIIQDVFEYLWKTRETSNIKSLRAYLYKAVAHKVSDYLKKGYVHQRYVEHFRIFEAVYAQAENTEGLQQLIEHGLKSLPDRVQMAIRLRLSEDLSNDEIAKRMQVTNKTIENYMHQVYTHFRKTYRYFSKSSTITLYLFLFDFSISQLRLTT